jgi:hypothetical protein
MNQYSLLMSSLMLLLPSLTATAQPLEDWRHAWPDTDFSRTTVDLSELQSGGPGKDGIPAIDNPEFIPLTDYRGVDEKEPVIGIVAGNEARAYPIRILIWHEIVNDVIK